MTFEQGNIAIAMLPHLYRSQRSNPAQAISDRFSKPDRGQEKITQNKSTVPGKIQFDFFYAVTSSIFKH
jgi:hypothetical protein